MKIRFKIDLDSLEKQEAESERLNKILGTEEIKPVPVAKKEGETFKVKFKKKLNNKN